MKSITVSKPVRGSVVEVLPASPGTGLVLNGIPVKVENVIHHEFRVDLRSGENYAFIVEHPLGSVRLFAIRDALIRGIREKWDFTRPEDRYAYSIGLGPDSVVGPPDGSISGGLVEAITKVGVKIQDVDIPEYTVARHVEYKTSDGGYIKIDPAPAGYGVDIRLRLHGIGPIEAHLDLKEGLKPRELILKVGRSTTPFLQGPNEEALHHALGDLLGDITGTGGLDDVYIDANLTYFYHLLTIGIVKKAEIVEAK